MTCSPRARHFLKRVTVLKGLSSNPLIRLKRSWSVGSFRRMENVSTGLIIQNGGGGGAEGGTRQDIRAEAAGGNAW